MTWNLAERYGRWGILKKIRAASVALMFFVVITGGPQAALARTECEVDVISCHETAQECLAASGQEPDDCEVFGQEECPGHLTCHPASTYGGCEERYDFAVVCNADDPL